MKIWKKAVLIMMCIGMMGSMTACAGKNRVNDATAGTNTGESLGEDLKDGAEDLKDDVEDGVRDVEDGVEDALDGDDRNGTTGMENKEK